MYTTIQVVQYADSTYYGIIRTKPAALYVCLLFGELRPHRVGCMPLLLCCETV
jgi:hypothetical protein